MKKPCCGWLEKMNLPGIRDSIDKNHTALARKRCARKGRHSRLFVPDGTQVTAPGSKHRYDRRSSENLPGMKIRPLWEGLPYSRGCRESAFLQC